MVRSLIALVSLLGLALAPGAPASAQLTSLKLLVPASPGGGWDQTARAMEQALRADRLVSGAIRITNHGGAGGTIGLAGFSRAVGEGNCLLVMGLVMMGAILTSRSPVTLEAVTPIARLTSEYLVVAVPPRSTIRTLHDLLEAIRKNPGAVSIAGGARGGVDHVLAALLVEAAGVPASKVNYIAYAGGGEAVIALLGAHVAAGISGYAEFQALVESGKLRALAVSARSRLPGVNVPTLREQGVDVEFGNWRGVVAPEGLRGDDRKTLLDTMNRMAHSLAWRTELKRHSWDDAYLSGEAFAAFMKSENDRLASVLRTVGLVR